MLTIIGLLSLIYPFAAGQANFTTGLTGTNSSRGNGSNVFDLFYRIQTNQIIGVRSCRNLADCGTRQRCDPLLHLCLPADYPPLQEIEKSCHVDDDCSPLYSCIGYLCRFCGPKHCGANTDCCPGVPSGLQYQCLNTETLVRDQVNAAHGKKKATRAKREADEGSSGEESESDSESESEGESEKESKSSKKSSSSKSKSESSKSEGKKGASSKKSSESKGKGGSKKEATSKKESSKKDSASKSKKGSKKAEEEPVEEEAAMFEENEEQTAMNENENEENMANEEKPAKEEKSAKSSSSKWSSKNSKNSKGKAKEAEDATAGSDNWGHSSSLNTWGSPNSANVEGGSWGSQDTSNFGIKPVTAGVAAQGAAKTQGSANTASNLINHLMSQYPLMTGKHCISQCITDYDCYRLRIPEEFRNNITCCQGHCFPRKLCLTNMQSGSPVSQSFLLSVPQVGPQAQMTYQIQLQLQPQPVAPAALASQQFQANQANQGTTTTAATITTAGTTTTTTGGSGTGAGTTTVRVAIVTAENTTIVPF